MANYESTTSMASAHPTIHREAVRFRVTRLIEGEAEACRQLGFDRVALVNRWHLLQAREARAAA